MKLKTIITSCILFFCLQAVHSAEIKFLNNPTWATVLEQAKKEKKIIFFDAYATWCGPCKMMDDETYTNDEVAQFYNTNFINVKYDMEKGEGPMLADRFYVNSYPSLIFISPEGAMLHKGVGFLASNEFLALGKKALKPELQYFSIKKNAKNLTPKEFLAFAKQATELQDEDIHMLSEDYLSAHKDYLEDSNLIALIMNYVASLPTEKDIIYFKDSKTRVLREGIYTDDDFEEKLVSLVMNYALSEKVQLSDDIDFELVKDYLNKYVPEQSAGVLTFYKVQYYLAQKENDLAFNILDNLLLKRDGKIEFERICGAMINFIPIFHNDETKFNTLIQHFSTLSLKADENSLDYIKDFSLSAIYIKVGDLAKFKESSAKVLNNKNTPENFKKEIETALQEIENKSKN